LRKAEPEGYAEPEGQDAPKGFEEDLEEQGNLSSLHEVMPMYKKC